MAWQKMPFFNFPHYKSMGTLSCHSNQTKGQIFIKNTNFQSPSPWGCYRWNLGPIGPVASEEMLFKSVDGRRRRHTTDDIRQTPTTTDNCLSYKLPRSLRLWWAKKRLLSQFWLAFCASSHEEIAGNKYRRLCLKLLHVKCSRLSIGYVTHQWRQNMDWITQFLVWLCTIFFRYEVIVQMR